MKIIICLMIFLSFFSKGISQEFDDFGYSSKNKSNFDSLSTNLRVRYHIKTEIGDTLRAKKDIIRIINKYPNILEIYLQYKTSINSKILVDPNSIVLKVAGETNRKKIIKRIGKLLKIMKIKVHQAEPYESHILIKNRNGEICIIFGGYDSYFFKKSL